MRSSAGLIRKATADGAQALWTGSRNIPQAWFRHADSAHIRNMAARVSALNCRAQHHVTGSAQYTEQHGSLVIAAPGSTLPRRDSSVADAAQWLFLNRTAVGSDFLARTDPEKILRVCEIAKRWDAAPCPFEEKKYSLSDLRRAYDMGFEASGEGWNGEVTFGYSDDEDYQAKRREALREYK